MMNTSLTSSKGVNNIDILLGGGVYNGQKNDESAANMSKSFIFTNVNERIGLECQKSSAVQKLPIA